MALCSFLSFFLSLIFVPIVILLCRKFNWYDEIDPRKIHEGQIPRLGGFALFIAFFLSLAVYLIFFNNSPVFYALPILVGALIIFFFGILDDFFNLPAKLKFVVQIVASLTVSFSPLYCKSFFGLNFPSFLGRFFTFSWILFLVNAYNLIDGLDLLCGGLSFISLMTIGIFMLVGGQSIGSVYIILCAAILGFLVYNKPPARIFLGDGGSQTLGFAVAMFPIFPLQGGLDYAKPLAAFLIVSIPFTDVIAAVIRRTREHRAIFAADRAHIHHKLVNIGFSKSTTAIMLLIIQGFICFSAVSVLFMAKTRDAIIMLCVSLLLVWAFFVALHYINRIVNLNHRGHLEDAPQEEH